MIKINISDEEIEKFSRLKTNHGAKAVTESMNMYNYSTDKKRYARKLISYYFTHGEHMSTMLKEIWFEKNWFK
jgi:hypothetical protein